jgi:peptidoglycan/LPS O-acetylase OafA/YrhL
MNIFAGATFTSNFVLWAEAGYFDSAAETKPLLHLWSLGVEEQFYIFWPALLSLAWRRRINIFCMLLLIATVSFALNVITVKSHPVAAFYSPLTRFWELMIGSALAYLAPRARGPWTGLNRHFSRAPGISDRFYGIVVEGTFAAGLSLIVTAIFSINQKFSFPGWLAPLPAVGAVLILMAGAASRLGRLLLANEAMVRVGLVSYPRYHWHWPLLSFAYIFNAGVPPTRSAYCGHAGQPRFGVANVSGSRVAVSIWARARGCGLGCLSIDGRCWHHWVLYVRLWWLGLPISKRYSTNRRLQIRLSN